MAQQSQPRRFIESCYAPDQLQTATQGRRLAGYVVDSIIVLLTFGFGWLVWLLLVAPRGQSPGKQLLGMYIVRADGTRAGGAYTWVRELIVKVLLFGGVFAVLGAATGGFGQLLWVVPALWCVWDAQRQCLWDKVASTYIAHSPQGFRPFTANEMRVRGEQPPAADGIPTGRVESSAPPPPSGLMDYPRDAASIREQSTADRLRELQRLHSDTRRLQRAFEQPNRAVREWGAVTGQRYIDRVETLETTERVQDLFAIRPLDFHPLTGDRRGQYALRLTGQMRMIVTIEDGRTVIVEEVVDYHG